MDSQDAVQADPCATWVFLYREPHFNYIYAQLPDLFLLLDEALSIKARQMQLWTLLPSKMWLKTEKKQIFLNSFH